MGTVMAAILKNYSGLAPEMAAVFLEGNLMQLWFSIKSKMPACLMSFTLSSFGMPTILCLVRNLR